jgi:predicted lipoprotein with Yx(FWY)xxD motif
VNRPAIALLAAAVIAAAVLGVVVLSRSPSAKEHPPATPARAAGVDVRVARARLGRILVDGRGRTLYLFLKDRHGRSACSASCARVWPPALVSGRPRAGAGVHADRLRTTRRAGDGRQLVYNGHPLYRMSADRRPGQIAGQGFLGVWYVVSPAGRMVGRRHRAGEGY